MSNTILIIYYSVYVLLGILWNIYELWYVSKVDGVEIDKIVMVVTFPFWPLGMIVQLMFRDFAFLPDEKGIKSVKDHVKLMEFIDTLK